MSWAIRDRARRLCAMLMKELRQIVRDPSTIMITAFLPPLLMFLFGYGVSLDITRMRIGLSVQDDSEAARSIAGAFQSSRYFDVVETGALQELTRGIVAGNLRGVVVIPDGFGRASAQGSGTIQVITDGSSPNTANFVAAYSEGVRSQWAEARDEHRGEARGSPAITLNPRVWFNPELASRYFLVPGAIVIVMTMVGTLLTSLVIAREWERGTMEAILATPLGMLEFMASKMIPYLVLALGSMLFCTALAVFLFGVPFRGSIWALLAISSAFLMPALGLGLFISAATKNQFVASQIALIAGFLPAFLLSGFIFEISSMPRWVRVLCSLLPARYLIAPLQTTFLVGDDWRLFLPNIGVMLGFGAILLLLAWRKNKRVIA